MRRRTEVHTPTFGAFEYTLGEGKSVTLLGGDLSQATEIHARLVKELTELGVRRPGLAAKCILLFHLWDDPHIEWEEQEDPDLVLDLVGEPLKELAERLLAEFFHIKARRLGLVPRLLFRFVFWAMVHMTQEEGEESLEITQEPEAEPESPGGK